MYLDNEFSNFSDFSVSKNSNSASSSKTDEDWKIFDFKLRKFGQRIKFDIDRKLWVKDFEEFKDSLDLQIENILSKITEIENSSSSDFEQEIKSLKK